MKAVRILCRIVTGIVFIFSGFVKGIDPLGFTYKFHDYFVAFGIDFLNPIALPLAILLSATEFTIGISLLIGYRPRFGAWGVLLFMGFFVPLTLILAITNPVSDCGCFGDAIVLTNWETFFKNLILLVFVLVVFLTRKKYKPVYSPHTEWGILGTFFLLFTLLSINSCRHLPFLDFRPYNVGAYLPEKMVIPEGAQIDEYETILIYEKNGVQKEFTVDNFPWQDSTWTFVDQQSFLTKEGYTPPIHDFEIISPDGDNITDQILSDPRFSFLVVSYNMSDADREGLQIANDLSIYCAVNDYPFYFLTASLTSDVNSLKQELNLTFNVFSTDETALKTVIRSNPGFLLLREGVVIGKWHFRDFPAQEKWKGHFMPQLLEKYAQNLERSRSFNLILLALLGIALVEIIRRNILKTTSTKKGSHST